MMTLIRKCIDEVKNDIDGICKTGTPGSSNCLECFHEQYFSGNKISYGCYFKPRIYFARFFPVHAKENEEALSLLPRDYRLKILRQNPINIMSIGGGPGSDSYAMKKYLVSREVIGEITSKKDVYLLRIDKEKKWNEIASEVNSLIKNTKYLQFDARRDLFDITEKKEWPKINSRRFHIFTMSYFLSELINEKQVKAIANYINNYSDEKCSVLLLNDRNDDKVSKYVEILFDNLICNTDYEIDNDFRCHCGVSYSDTDKAFIGPKLKTNSIRYVKALFI